MLLLGGGSCSVPLLPDLRPVLLTYAFGVLFSAFAVAYRYAVWLQRPPTRVAVRRGFALLRRGNPLRNLVYVIRLLGGTFAAQHFIRSAASSAGSSTSSSRGAR